MINRREFIKGTAAAGAGLILNPLAGLGGIPENDSRVIAVASDNVLTGEKYNPDAVHRMFGSGLKEMTGENSLENAWSSMFNPDDVVGIKINCVGSPKISTSVTSVNEVIEGLKSAGVKENNIIVWGRTDMEVRRAGFDLNRGTKGVRYQGVSPKNGTLFQYSDGYDSDIFYRNEDGTLKKFRKLMEKDFIRDSSYREIVNSMTWLYMLVAQGNEKAAKYSQDMRALFYGDENREKLLEIAKKVIDEFADVEIEGEDKSCFANIVTKDVNKLINLCVIKHNIDSGITLALKNIALGVTTNKVRFHRDFCKASIAAINSFPCIKDKLVLNIGEAAKISVLNCIGRQIVKDNRIFFSADPVAMDRIGLDILEEKRIGAGLSSIRHEATHIASSAKAGLGTDDMKRIDYRQIKI
ncbi:DUF362 domain-containing protein [candidate division KSB1 bacterium]